MEAVQNFFERKINFVRRDNYDVSRLGLFLLDSACYKSEIGSYNGSIYGKVKSFFHHLASNHASANHEGYRYDGSIFDIGIMLNPGEDDCDYENLGTIAVKPRGDTLEFKERNFGQLEPHSSYPMQIYIDARGEYASYELEEEFYESEDESEEEVIPLKKSHKEDKCVICLDNEPKILFYDCLHYCVCRECEERKPFKKCPCCRTRILTKIIV